MNRPKHIVVIGTSAGGVRALEELTAQLTPDMDAAFFVVIHLSRKGVGDMFFHRLKQYCAIDCKVAEHEEPIKKGTLYLAPPDQHLVLSKNQVLLTNTAQENHWRPSINNLFRSAAANFTSRVIGIVLTGLLDDGTVGMAAIKKVGGITIVQDPNEADHADMPLSVLSNIEVNYVESLSRMGNLLSEIITNSNPQETEVPCDVAIEARLDRESPLRIDDLQQFEKFDINCPDCGGSLYVTQKEHPTHTRCHVGHSFTDRELLVRLTEVTEDTFWTLLRLLEERRKLHTIFYEKEKQKGYGSGSQRHMKKAQELEKHIADLQKLLAAVSKLD